MLEANHQAATNTRGLRSRGQSPARLPTLHSWPGRNLHTRPLGLVAISSFIVRPEAPKVQQATKHRKQLAAGKATHKSDLDGGRILLGKGWRCRVEGGGLNPSDIVMFSAHYFTVNMETEWR